MSSTLSIRRAGPQADSLELPQLARWMEIADRLAVQYRTAEPYPHIVLDNFVDPNWLAAARDEFPQIDSADWISYVHVNEKKFGQNKREFFPPTLGEIVDTLNGPEFVKFLCRLTGFDDLLPDPSLEGGGLHQSKRGGFLNIHADFTAHPFHKTWARRVNVLVYLNEGWRSEFGGELELWDREAKNCIEKILPLFNRCVIFSTDKDSFHGHPEPMTCPAGMTRKSIALYYFTEESPEDLLIRSTEYRAKPGASALKRAAIFADKMALRLYSAAKRRYGLKNEPAQALLRRIFRS